MSAALNVSLAQLLLGKEGEVKIESTESDKKYCMGIFADGIYEQRTTPVGVFTYKKYNVVFPYLDKKGDIGFEFKLPKVPFGLLHTVSKFFYSIMQEMNNSEVMVQIYWNFTKQEYFIYVPVQRVAGASISFDHSEELLNNPEVCWVIDIHSHNTMGAFFSGTDSADEKSTRLFGVIGRIKSAEDFDSVWRAGCNGSFKAQQLEDIFDLTDNRAFELPADVKSRVTRYVHQPVKYTAPTYAGYNRPNYGAPQHNGSYWINKKETPDRRYFTEVGHKHGKAHDPFDDLESAYADFYRHQLEDNDVPGKFDVIEMDDQDIDIWGADNDIDEEIFDCYSNARIALSSMFAEKNNGELTVESLSQYLSIICQEVMSLDEFGGDAVVKMLELASAQMRTEDFDKTIMGFNEQYGYK